jgi:4-diphosphocytidyl-2-C-methyl-D-erythritol kinase
MITFPPCKINLGLNIVRKRADGYHDLVTCFYPVPWTDMLEIVVAEKLTFSSSGNAIPGDAADNLCLKAYHLLREDFGLSPVSMHLHKVIPTGAGLGGGSSDAAHTLRLLNELFELHLGKEQLKTYAARVGSDCAFFIDDQPMLGTGRGEVLAPLHVDLKGKFLVIVKPEIHVSTAQAYSGVHPKEPVADLAYVLETEPVEKWRTSVVNDFEETVFARHPSLREIKESLYEQGAVYAAMSGSGAAVFGLFNAPEKIKFSLSPYWSCTL